MGTGRSKCSTTIHECSTCRYTGTTKVTSFQGLAGRQSAGLAKDWVTTWTWHGPAGWIHQWGTRNTWPRSVASWCQSRKRSTRASCSSRRDSTRPSGIPLPLVVTRWAPLVSERWPNNCSDWRTVRLFLPWRAVTIWPRSAIPPRNAFEPCSGTNLPNFERRNWPGRLVKTRSTRCKRLSPCRYIILILFYNYNFYNYNFNFQKTISYRIFFLSFFIHSADVSLALRQVERAHGFDERDRSRTKGTRRDRDSVRDGLFIDAAAYQFNVRLHISDAWSSIRLFIYVLLPLRDSPERFTHAAIYRFFRTTPEHSREVSEEPMEQDDAKWRRTRGECWSSIV